MSSELNKTNEQQLALTQTAEQTVSKVEIPLLERDPLTLSPAELKEFRAQLTLRKDQLELAKLIRENRAAEARELELRQQAEREGRNFEELRKRDAMIQEACTHRKGGTDTASLNKQGNDSNFSVVKHTGTFGETTVLCTRCCKLWLPKDPDHNGKPTPGYGEALRFPTDNAPSSSVVFAVRATGGVLASAHV